MLSSQLTKPCLLNSYTRVNVDTAAETSLLSRHDAKLNEVLAEVDQSTK